MAGEVIARAAGRAKVYFKFTCPTCGERLTLEEPNILYEDGECAKCGVTAPIEKAGYMLLLQMPKKDATDIIADELEAQHDATKDAI
jgi:predicted RNA-binding Zn-ribbon protein involved in translation (DUF1610 family)